LNIISKSDCRDHYRFDQDELRQIIPLLPFPEYIITPIGDKAHIIEAFCLVLRRMANRGKMKDYVKDFGRSEGSLNRIMLYMTHLILQRAGRSILFYPVTAEQLERYRNAFRRKGVPDNLPVVAVLDNKKQLTCRPTHNQKSQFNRYKKGHGPKHQTLNAPDGLVLHEYPGDGRPGDSVIAGESRIAQYWRAHPLLHNYRILTDSAYGANDVFVAMYKRRPGEAALPLERRIFNSTLAPSRTMGVENGYCIIISLWPFLDNKKAMKYEKSPILAYWSLGVWLTNLHICIPSASAPRESNNQISEFFACPPPTRVEFINRTLN
jgi:hypothetical protein